MGGGGEGREGGQPEGMHVMSSVGNFCIFCILSYVRRILRGNE